MRPGLRCAIVAALAIVGVTLGGCGEDDSTTIPVGNPRLVGGGGELGYAIPLAPEELDPLTADSTSEQTVVRQIYEPLVASIDAPYGGRRDATGPALSSRHSGDFRVWSLRLRVGIRFQDGMPLNASAVLANVERWRASAVGQELLSGLIAADGPRPDLVRFVFSSSLLDLPRRLSDPRLGLVSPAALESAAGPSLSENAGSGPYRLAALGRERVSLDRFRGWWGSRQGLGPALDGIAFRIAEGRPQRLALLRDGAVRVAGDVGDAAAERLQASALFTALDGAGPAIGLERSVRGIRRQGPIPLSGVWLAVLDQAG